MRLCVWVFSVLFVAVACVRVGVAVADLSFLSVGSACALDLLGRGRLSRPLGAMGVRC